MCRVWETTCMPHVADRLRTVHYFVSSEYIIADCLLGGSASLSTIANGNICKSYARSVCTFNVLRYLQALTSHHIVITSTIRCKR